ncbi:MAG: insulinase family protein [Balneolaceae bacterium]|nr:insulinase family protein [Balneolaceae bacterium]
MKIFGKLRILGILLILMGFGYSTTQAQYLEEFENKVTEFTLDNGLHFIIIERHQAPVASFYTAVNVGGVDEPVGNTGIAHIFEHMAFKGNDYIGTTDWEKESKVIEQMDEAYQAWLAEKYSVNPDSVKLEELWSTFQDLQENSKQYVVNNEFSKIIEKNGGTGLNASTSSDRTNYFYSLPSNRAELWFNLEAGRFKKPIFREFYVEKEVVREERRMRTESNPVGRLVEEFIAVAYTAHPYGRPVVGWNSDITATTIEDAHDFYEKYYVPSNMTMAIAGDVDPDRMKELAETYFGDLEAGEPAPKVTTIEPPQRGERRFTIEGKSQPILLMGYHGVSQSHEDFEALNLMGNMISTGRTSRLYKKLVEEEKMALQVGAFNGFPGSRFSSLFLTLAVPNRGIDVDSLEQAVYTEIEAVKEGDLTQEELDRARTNIRANLIRGLNNNTGLALSFANAHMDQGNWREVFRRLDRIEQVTLEDIQRVAKKYLVKDQRTVGATVKADS